MSEQAVWVVQDEQFCKVKSIAMQKLAPWIDALGVLNPSKMDPEEALLWEQVRQGVENNDALVGGCEGQWVDASVLASGSMGYGAIVSSTHKAGELTAVLLNDQKIPDSGGFFVNGFDALVVGSWMHLKMHQMGHKNIVRKIAQWEGKKIEALRQQTWALMSAEQLVDSYDRWAVRKDAQEQGWTGRIAQPRAPHDFVKYLYNNIAVDQMRRDAKVWRQGLVRYLTKVLQLKVQQVPGAVQKKVDVDGTRLPWSAPVYQVPLLYKSKSMTQSDDTKLGGHWMQAAKNAHHIAALWDAKKVSELQKQCVQLERLVVKKAAKATDAQIDQLALQLSVLYQIKQALPELPQELVNVPVQALQVQQGVDRHLQSSAYALVAADGGYVAANGITGGGVANAKLFDSLSRAKLSAKSNGSVAAIVQVQVEPIKVVHQVQPLRSTDLQEALSRMEQQQLQAALQRMPLELLEGHLKELGVSQTVLDEVKRAYEHKEHAQQEQTASSAKKHRL